MACCGAVVSPSAWEASRVNQLLVNSLGPGPSLAERVIAL